jgi:beta-glucanase (GH16 family)
MPLASCASSSQPASHASHGPAATHKAQVPSTARWRLTWHDEFNSPSSLNEWAYSVGGDGWSLKQLQWYDASNAVVDRQGDLVITASKNGQGQQCWYGPCRYSSVRMTTFNKFSQTYGRFEARIRIPTGAGLWPAFWLEGTNIFQVGWPESGEVDIVESNGQHPDLVQGYAHAPTNSHSSFFTLPSPISAGFHVYGVDWSPQGITWFVDGHPYGHMQAYPGWPFNHPFYIILNLAVGGSWPGSPNSSTPFPARMVISWVRVYREVTPKAG